MRILTPEYISTLQSNKDYIRLINTPPPDLSSVRKEAEVFSRWIAREHKRERANMRMVPAGA